MHQIGLSSVFVLFLYVTSSLTEDCFPGYNCKAPTCRCWNDGTPPGGIAPNETPQMVVISFAGAVNDANFKLFTQLFEDIKNPNGCPATGTFFVQSRSSSSHNTRSLHDAGHEIGISSADGSSPTPNEWHYNIGEAVHFFIIAGIRVQDINGVRDPHLQMGGDPQMTAVHEFGMKYDSSCVIQKFSDRTSMLWPYTYDFVIVTPECVSGETPKSSHPGVWELVLPEFTFKDRMCATPSACSPLMDNSNSDDSYDFLAQNFWNHHDYKRTPFFVELDTQWFSEPAQVEGTRRFLQYVRSTYTDTWIISNSQVLAYMSNPVTVYQANGFPPFGCK